MFAVTRHFSKDLTSYDLLKTLAVVLMVADHAGAYFFPDEPWFRVLGRLCVPIWFFLIGYAESREIPKSFWIGTGVLMISAFVIGQPFLPLPILVTFALGRYCIDGVMHRALRTPETLAGMFFILALSSFHSAVLSEYGTLGLLLMMYGYICRHKEAWVIPLWHKYLFISGVFLVFFGHEVFFLPWLSPLQLVSLFVGCVFVFVLLALFRPREYPVLKKYAGIVIPFFQLCGRWSLELYIVHLVLFRVLSAALWPENYRFFDLQLMPENVQQFFFS